MVWHTQHYTFDAGDKIYPVSWSLGAIQSEGIGHTGPIKDVKWITPGKHNLFVHVSIKLIKLSECMSCPAAQYMLLVMYYSTTIL